MIIKATRTSPYKNLRTPAPAWNQCKSQIRSPISREPIIERCWNFELYLSLCAANARDYTQQHWIETLALPRHNTIRPLSDLHRVRRCNCCCSNTGCVLIENMLNKIFDINIIANHHKICATIFSTLANWLIYIQRFSDSELLKYSHRNGRIRGSQNCSKIFVGTVFHNLDGEITEKPMCVNTFDEYTTCGCVL